MSGPAIANEGVPGQLPLAVIGPTLVTSRHRPFAHVVSVEGGQALAAFDTRGSLAGQSEDERVEIGSIVAITTPSSHIIGVVTGLSVPMGSYEVGEDAMRLMELDLVGEIIGSIADRSFKRGVSLLPALGDAVARASHQDLEMIYTARRRPSVTIGSLYQDAEIPASIVIDASTSESHIENC